MKPVVAICSAASAGPTDKSADPSLPPVKFGAFEGTRYEALVPNTLDLAERMKFSLNAITRCVSGPPANPFPPTRYTCNHFIVVNPWPKVTRSVVIYGKAMLGALMARMVTGVEANIHVDEDWRGAWLEWSRINPIMLGPEGGRRLSWIALNYLRDGDPRWLALGRRAVSRLNETAAPHKDGAWIHPGLTTTPPDDACIDATHLSPNPAVIAEMKKADPQKVCRGWNATWMSWTLIGLCDFYRASGDAAALTLAGRFARYLKDYAGVLSPDGRFLAGHPHPWPVVHFHHCYNTAQSILDYGIVSKDREYIDFARRVYEHMLTFCSREIGFAPEYCYGQYPRKQSFDNTEACCSADLIMMAMSLTEAGAGDYWDDIDRYIRNHIATLQLTDTRWFYNIPENRNKGWRYPNPDVEQAVGRLTGNFGGWAGVNEWHIPEVGGGIMTCCLGNATRAFYYVHNRIVDFDDGTLRVNLLLNRASRWADINSYVPYQGRVDIQLKQAIKHIRVRVPEWIKTASNDLKCTVDGQERKVNWQGRYVDVGSGSPGQAIVVTFPIGLRKVKTEIGRRPYTLTIKGNTVVAVDPPGKRIPLYQRDKYLGGDAPIVRVRRYVPKTDVALGCEGSEHKRTPSN